MTHVFRWRNNPARALYYGRRCKIVVRGTLNSCLLEFENGDRIVTSRNAIRRIAAPALSLPS